MRFFPGTSQACPLAPAAAATSQPPMLHVWLFAPGPSNSIYARLRSTCDWLAGRLADADIDCAAYHAGKDSEQRGKVRCHAASAMPHSLQAWLAVHLAPAMAASMERRCRGLASWGEWLVPLRAWVAMLASQLCGFGSGQLS